MALDGLRVKDLFHEGVIHMCMAQGRHEVGHA